MLSTSDVKRKASHVLVGNVTIITSIVVGLLGILLPLVSRYPLFGLIDVAAIITLAIFGFISGTALTKRGGTTKALHKRVGIVTILAAIGIGLLGFLALYEAISDIFYPYSKGETDWEYTIFAILMTIVNIGLAILGLYSGASLAKRGDGGTASLILSNLFFIPAHLEIGFFALGAILYFLMSP
jgi:hypothetical protein